MSEDFSFGKTLSNSYNLSTAIVAPQGDIPESVAQKQYVDDKDAVLQQQITSTQADLNGFPDQLKFLDTAEIQQLENIGGETISNTQWSYLGGLDQAMTTTSDVVFDSVTVGGVEMKRGVVGEDVVFQTTDTENRIRINKQGDFRFYNDAGIRTYGQDENVLTGYDQDGDELWSWFTDTAGTDNDTIFQAKNKAGTVSTYDINRNGTVISRDPSGNLKFRMDTSNGRFTTDEIRLPTGSGFDSAINSSGLCIRTVDSATNCLLNVFNTGSTFLSNTGDLLMDVNSAGATVPNDKDFVITGGPTLKGVDSALDVIETNLTITTGIATTNQSNIATNTTNISNNSSSITTVNNLVTVNTIDINNRVFGQSVGTTTLAGTTSQTNLASGFVARAGIISDPVTLLDTSSKNVIIQGSTNTISARDSSVVIGSFTGSNTTAGNNSVYIGYGVRGNDESNSVIIGTGLNATGNGGNNNVTIGSNSSNNATDSCCIGFNCDIFDGVRNLLFGSSSSVVTGSSQSTLVGNQSTVGGIQSLSVGNGNTVRGKSTVVGNLNNNSTIVGGAIDNVFLFGNSLTNQIHSNVFMVGDTLTNNVSSGIFFEQIFETTSGGGADVVFDSVAGGLSRLSTIVSSRRHKEEIQDLEGSYFDSSDIYKVKPKCFKYKTKETKDVGVIAEDYIGTGTLLESLIVWGDEKDVDESEPRNEKGQCVKSFNYRGLIVPMLAEMKKLKEQNDKLVKQVNSLSALLKDHVKNCSL